MPLLTLADAQLSYGELPLLDRASFVMEAGERIGLIGRNGTGKSSLLGAIAGTLELDDGELRRNEGLRVALVEQEPRLPHAPTVRASLLLRGHIPSIHDERERWQAEARLTEFLRRELLHVADMCDPAFAYSPTPELGGSCQTDNDLIRDRFRLLWDAFVEARMRRWGWVAPDDHRQAAAPHTLLADVMQQETWTQSALLALARSASYAHR